MRRSSRSRRSAGRARRRCGPPPSRRCSPGRPRPSSACCAAWCSTRSGRAHWIRWCRTAWPRRSGCPPRRCSGRRCCWARPPPRPGCWPPRGWTALQAVGLQVGRSGAADAGRQRTGSGRGAVDKTGLPAVVDTKLDGIRVQVHRDGPTDPACTPGAWTTSPTGCRRSCAVVAALPVQRLVLDGEVLAVGAGRPAAGVPADRVPDHDQDDPGDRRDPAVPLSLFCFDLLHVDGRDLLDEPLSERIAVMAAVLPESLIVPPDGRPRDVAAVEAAFADAVARRVRGRGGQEARRARTRRVGGTPAGSS